MAKRTAVAAFLSNKYARFAGLWLVAYLVLLSWFFNTVLGDYRYLEIFPQELLLPALIHALTALFIALAIYWLPWHKSYSGKLTSAVVLALLLIGYDGNLGAVDGLISAFFPALSTGDDPAFASIIYLLLLFVLAVCVGLLLEKVVLRSKQFRASDMGRAVLALVAVLFMIPAISMFGILPQMINQASVEAAQFTAPTSKPADKPDIYYIVLDRYTNREVLKQQFQFDNSAFTQLLQKKGFHFNDQAYGNYPYTAMSVSSTLNGIYTNKLVEPFKSSDVQSRDLYNNLIWQSSIIKSLKQAGYQYYNLGSWYGATYKAPLSERDYMWEHKLHIFGHERVLHGIEANEFLASPYYRFAKAITAGWWPLRIEDTNQIDNVRKQLNTLDDLATKEPAGGRFIFSHILVPHDPFFFNADGSLATSTGTDNVGRPIKQKYIGQVEFINKQILQLISSIQKSSKGQAVIILNADEGAYPQVMNDSFRRPAAAKETLADGLFTEENMKSWSDSWLKMKFGILQAVYMPKATDVDLAHLSSVNLFRIVLNRYLGYNLDYLPQCHFGLTEGTQNQFIYADITGRFESPADRTCSQYQSLK